MTRARQNTSESAARSGHAHAGADAGMVARGRGFTLLELIVVISIIAILAALSLLVGRRVMESGRVTLTQSLIRTVDNTIESYQADRDGKAPYKWTDTSSQHNEFGIIDGRIDPVPAGPGPGQVIEPSVTFLLLALGDSPSVQSTIKGIDSKFIVRAPISNAAAPNSYDPTDFRTIYTRQTVMPQTATPAEQVFGFVIKDPWGNALRYVSPKFDGGYGSVVPASGGSPTLPPGQVSDFATAQKLTLRQNNTDWSVNFRRSHRPGAGETGDADAGLTRGGRGYFYSPGPDKDAGTRDDNVYMDAPPQFPKP